MFDHLDELSKKLLPPLREVVKHCRVLYIVPGSHLYTIPFADQARTIADLNWADCEIAPETTTADDLLTRAAAYSVLHLACHGKVDKTPYLLLASSLTLAHEARLTAKQIYRLDRRLNSELVFLNACVSANFKQSIRNEVGGFWLAFLQAGTPSLIATLTFVDPRTAQALALNFYKVWLAGGITKAEALQQAQLRMFKRGIDPQVPIQILHRDIEPYDWASHVLIGYHR